MKSAGWVTFALALGVSLKLMQKEGVDQQARNWVSISEKANVDWNQGLNTLKSSEEASIKQVLLHVKALSSR